MDECVCVCVCARAPKGSGHESRMKEKGIWMLKDGEIEGNGGQGSKERTWEHSHACVVSHLKPLLGQKVSQAQDHTDGYSMRVPHPVRSMSDVFIWANTVCWGVCLCLSMKENSMHGLTLLSYLLFLCLSSSFYLFHLNLIFFYHFNYVLSFLLLCM